MELALPDATVEQVHAVEARMVAWGRRRVPCARRLADQADLEAAYTGILGPTRYGVVMALLGAHAP